MKYLCFDTETTELVRNSLKPLARQPHVIEWAAVVLDDACEAVSEHEWLVQPGFEITPETTKMTGITPAMLADKPMWPAIMPSVQALLDSADAYIGQNLMFDVQMTSIEMQRVNPDWRFSLTKPMYCTIENSEHIMGGRASLSNLHAHFFGVPHSGAHRALADVKATARVFKALREMGAV